MNMVTTRQLAKAMGVSRATILRLAKVHGITGTVGVFTIKASPQHLQCTTWDGPAILALASAFRYKRKRKIVRERLQKVGLYEV